MAKSLADAIGNVISLLEEIKQGVDQPLIESLSGTHGPIIIDYNLAEWTIGENSTLLRGGIDTAGRGTVYLYLDRTIYTLGVDNNWYSWTDGRWVFYGQLAPNTKWEILPTGTCANLSALGFWGNQDPFINRLKRASHWWHQYGVTNTGYTDPKTDWQHGIHAGDFITNLVCVRDIAGELDFTEQRAGKHVLLWKGDLTLTVHGQGINEGSEIAKGRYVVDVPASIQVDGVLKLANPEWSLTVKNNTVIDQDFAPITEGGVQYPALIHWDDEADFLAGKHYNSRFLASLSGFGYVRTMDWNLCPMQGVGNDGVDHAPKVEPDNYLTQDSRTYAMDDNNTSFFPPEEIGHLAREANIGIFNTMASKSSDATFDYWGKRFIEGAGEAWQGILMSEFGDENWNWGWPWNVGRKYLVANVAPSIKVVDAQGNPSTSETDAMGCATAARSIPMWTAMERYVPRERHKRVLGGQFAWTAAMGGMLAYVDPVSGKRVSELADYFAVAPYWGADRTGITLTDILQDKLWLQGDEYWINRCKVNIKQMVGALQTHRSYLAVNAPNMKLTCYEGGGWLWEESLPRLGDPLYTLAKQWGNYCRSFMDGEPGKIVTEFYWDTLIKGNFMLFNQYTNVGYVYGVQAGLINSIYRSDTPRQALMRTLGK